jgi:RimJ/RimL family protein N-acetyltransferase
MLTSAALTVRPYTEADIPFRYSLLQDPAAETNLQPILKVINRDEFFAAERAHLAQGCASRPTFVVETAHGKPVAMTWVGPIDWQHRVGDVALIVAPRFRIGYGTLVVIAVQRLLFEEYNLDVAISQVYSGNNMLQTGSAVLQHRQVTLVDEIWQGGEYWSAHLWTTTRNQFEQEWGRVLARDRALTRAGLTRPELSAWGRPAETA